MFGTIVKFFIFDVILDALYAPVWWYSFGLIGTLRSLHRALLEGAAIIGIGIWAKSLFKPMYGENSFQGRIISFVMRFFVLLFMTLQMIVWIGILCMLLLLWFAIPPLLILQIFHVFKII